MAFSGEAIDNVRCRGALQRGSKEYLESIKGKKSMLSQIFPWVEALPQGKTRGEKVLRLCELPEGTQIDYVILLFLVLLTNGERLKQFVMNAFLRNDSVELASADGSGYSSPPSDKSASVLSISMVKVTDLLSRDITERYGDSPYGMQTPFSQSLAESLALLNKTEKTSKEIDIERLIQLLSMKPLQPSQVSRVRK